MIGLLLIVAAGLLLLTLKPSKPASTVGPEARKVSETVQPDAQSARGQAASASTDRAARSAARSDAGARPAAAEADRDASAAADSPMNAAASDAERPTAREQAVAAWEALVDRLAEQTDVAAADQAPRVKEAFDRLDKQDQMDAIRRSLNLLPDEQFPALYDILFDKTEDPEVLDAIFSDALNRPEEIKNPLMKELVKDKTHPCFFESARILDVIGE